MVHLAGLVDPFGRPVSTAIPLLVVIALVAAVALCGVGIWAAIELAKAARSSRKLADDLDERVVPLTDKLDVSVDAFNAELLRVDMIVDQLEGAVDRFTGTADTVREVVDAPIHLVTEVAERVRKGFRRRAPRPKPHEPELAGSLPEAQGVEVVFIDSDDQPDLSADAERRGSEDTSVIEFPTEVASTEPGPEPAALGSAEADTAPQLERTLDSDEPESLEQSTTQTKDPEEA